MKAFVYHGPRDVRVMDVPDAKKNRYGSRKICTRQRMDDSDTQTRVVKTLKILMKS